MSVSTLHHHFRSLTALSPLQVEKHLRLNEARRLMLIDRVDAATAAFQVGCESPSQFSREYSGGTRPSGGRGVEKRNGKSPASLRAASFTPRRDFQVLFARDTSAGKLNTKRELTVAPK